MDPTKITVAQTSTTITSAKRTTITTTTTPIPAPSTTTPTPTTTIVDGDKGRSCSQHDEGPVEQMIQEQYGSARGPLLPRILAALDAATAAAATTDGKNDQPNPISLLSLMDAFNSQGRVGRMTLSRLLEQHLAIRSASSSYPQPQQHPIATTTTRVLDIGCGIGGTARYLHLTFGWDVTGVDLTRDFVDTGNALNARFLPQLSSSSSSKQQPHEPLPEGAAAPASIQLLHASALDLPFADHTFDVAWTEHVQMNVADKERFYGQASRVLKHGGPLAFHEGLLASNAPFPTAAAPSPPTYPCPWAETADYSFLVTEDALRAAMVRSELHVVEWMDTTAATIDFLTKATQSKPAKLPMTTPTPSTKSKSSDPPPLGIHLLMGPNFRQKMRNHLQNLQQGCTRVVMGIAVKQNGGYL